MDTWVTLEPMPTARIGFTIAVCEGKIYCMSGFIIDYSRPSYFEILPAIEFNVNEVYDPITNSWSTKVPKYHLVVIVAIYRHMLLMEKFLS
jgi:hypothetical protein